MQKFALSLPQHHIGPIINTLQQVDCRTLKFLSVLRDIIHTRYVNYKRVDLHNKEFDGIICFANNSVFWRYAINDRVKLLTKEDR